MSSDGLKIQSFHHLRLIWKDLFTLKAWTSQLWEKALDLSVQGLSLAFQSTTYDLLFAKLKQADFITLAKVLSWILPLYFRYSQFVYLQVSLPSFLWDRLRLRCVNLILKVFVRLFVYISELCWPHYEWNSLFTKSECSHLLH